RRHGRERTRLVRKHDDLAQRQHRLAAAQRTQGLGHGLHARLHRKEAGDLRLVHDQHLHGKPRSGSGRHHTRIPSVDSDVADLIAHRNYPKAVALLQAQLARRPQDARLRLKLADVLILAGRDKEAVGTLMSLADAEAADGFAAKAIAVLKRIEKIEPGRRDVEERLAHLIQEKVRRAPGPAGTAAGGRPELGLEEFDPSADPLASGAPPPE